MVVSAIEGHRIWSRQYDESPNPILALEMRVLAPRLGILSGRSICDAGSGTGRWMQWASSQGARVFGFDACREMIVESCHKPGLRGRSVQADVCRIPIKNNSVDIAICSFMLGYVPSPLEVLGELARIASCVIVSDLHPQAINRGWTRSFRAAGERYEMAHHSHSIPRMDAAAKTAGLIPAWRSEPSFGEPEREVFRRAGREAAFEEASRLPAILITAWNRSSD
jgi:SAM-dependent methyltransferase